MIFKFTTSAIEFYWPYVQLMRADKPKGAILVFWPFAYGLTLAAYRKRTRCGDFLELLLALTIGAFLIRSMGCTINDVFDREIDRQVERTKNRPLANGSITVSSAVIFAVAQGLACLALFSQLPTSAYHCGLMFFPLVTLYPLMKRVTNWPQAWLGVAANWGAAVAWNSVHETLHARSVIPLLVGLWAWTMIYDTIYAFQDRKDDAKIGVGSTALAMQGSQMSVFLYCMATIFVLSLAVVGKNNNNGPPFFILTVGGTAIYVMWQLKVVDLANPTSCAANFGHSTRLGLLIWSGMLVDYVLQAATPIV